MPLIQTITAKVLIQVDDGEPTQIGTVEIPIDLSTGKRPGAAYRGGSMNGAEISVTGGPLGPAAPSMAATQRLINRQPNLNKL